MTSADQSADQQRAVLVEAAGAMQIEPARLLQEPTDPDRPVLAEMVADLEPGDEVVVFNREDVGDDTAAAIEEKGATLHSVTEPY